MNVRLTAIDNRIIREVERVVMSSDGPMSKDMAEQVVELVQLRRADRQRRDDEAKGVRGVASTPATRPSSPPSRRPCRPKHQSTIVRHRVVDGKVDPKSVRVFKFKGG